MTATLPAEVAGLRPKNPPRRRGAIQVKPRPALSAGVVRHRRYRGDGWRWEQLPRLPPILRGLGRHRKQVLSWRAIAAALAHDVVTAPGSRTRWYDSGVS